MAVKGPQGVGVVCTSCGDVSRVDPAALEQNPVFACPRCGARRDLGALPARVSAAEGWAAPVFSESYASRAAGR